MAARYANDIDIAKAQRDFELKKAAYDQEVQTTKATSDLAYDLQAAKTKQRIKEEQMQIRVVERSQQIQIQEQEIVRRERELEAQIKKPADAEKFKLEKLSEANRYVRACRDVQAREALRGKQVRACREVQAREANRCVSHVVC